MRRFIRWTARKMESYPVAWRVALLILCFLLTGYLEAQDEEFFRQMDAAMMEKAR